MNEIFTETEGMKMIIKCNAIHFISKIYIQTLKPKRRKNIYLSGTEPERIITSERNERSSTVTFKNLRNDILEEILNSMVVCKNYNGVNSRVKQYFEKLYLK